MLHKNCLGYSVTSVTDHHMIILTRPYLHYLYCKLLKMTLLFGIWTCIFLAVYIATDVYYTLMMYDVAYLHTFNLVVHL